MTIRLDRDLLAELGLGELGDADAQQLLEAIYESLETRVGMVLVQQMTTAQLDEFEAAKQQGDAAALALLTRVAPDYQSRVTEEFEALKVEIASEAATLLHAYVQPSADHDPWRHRRPDAGPTLVGSPSGWALVVSPTARVVVALDPTRAELYGRRRGGLPVVLRVPDAHHIDPTTLWCNDAGEVRARFAEHSDLRWRLADRPSAPTRAWDKVWWRRRAPLRWTDERLETEEMVTFTRGRWRVRDGYHLVVEDRLDGRTVTLEPLHHERHWNALEPHFTPDSSQLVAPYNTNEPPEDCGIKSCSVGYLDAMKSARADGAREWPWEFEVHPAAADGPDPPVTPALPIDDIGYDVSSTRAAVLDRRRVHLYEVREWNRIGHVDRPDQRARMAEVPVPGGRTPTVVWAGRSLVVIGADGRRWRLDLQRGPGELETLGHLGGPGPGSALAAAVSWGDRAALVHEDRVVVTVDADGTVAEVVLPGEDAVRTAAAAVDGRLLLVSESSIELFAGTRPVATATLQGSPVAGIAPCARDAGWALAWHDDGSVSTVRIGARTLAVDRDTIPQLPSRFDHPPRARDAEFSAIDRWHLISPADEAGPHGPTRVVGVRGSLDVDATCLASMPSAGLAVFGTQAGLEFVANDLTDPWPSPVTLPGAVHAIATGQCARSVAAAGEGALWLVRLLR